MSRSFSVDAPPATGPMRIPSAFVFARRLSTPAVVHRGLVVSALVLAERLLIPAAAWALFGRALLEKIAFALGLGIVFSGRTFVQHALRWRTEADLLERVVTSVVKGDVLRASVLSTDDARAELGQAVYHATQSVAVELPLLAADGMAAIPLAILIVAGEPGRVVVLAIGTTLVAAVALLATRRSMETAIASAWAAHQRVLSAFVDALEGRLDLVASGRDAAFLVQMHSHARAWAKAGSRVAAGALLSGKLPFLAIAVAVAAGAALVGERGRNVLHVSSADVALLASMTPAFSGLAQGLFALARAERWMGMVVSVLAERPASLMGSRPPPVVPTPIVFDRVSFRYPGTYGDAVRELSFRWEGETVIALAGANGSGKSTCLRLLLGLARPQGGDVTVGGVPMDGIDARAWRARIAFLPQRPYIPPRSDVRAGVRFLVPEATDGAMHSALDRVGLLARLMRTGQDPLAVNIDTLSVGERQRLGLARLLCQDASSLVLLDEPDANLDRRGISLVANLVRELARGRMVAVVAHNEELLDGADRVIVLEEGRLVRDETRRRSSGQALAR